MVCIVWSWVDLVCVCVCGGVGRLAAIQLFPGLSFCTSEPVKCMYKI